MKLIRWFVVNGLFALFLYLGFFEDMIGFERLIIFCCWVSGIFGLLILSMPEAVAKAMVDKGYKNPIPSWVVGLYDSIVLAVLIYHGAIITGLVYSLNFLATQIIYNEIEKIKITNQMKGGM